MKTLDDVLTELRAMVTSREQAGGCITLLTDGVVATFKFGVCDVSCALFNACQRAGLPQGENGEDLYS